MPAHGSAYNHTRAYHAASMLVLPNASQRRLMFTTETLISSQSSLPFKQASSLSYGQGKAYICHRDAQLYVNSCARIVAIHARLNVRLKMAEASNPYDNRQIAINRIVRWELDIGSFPDVLPDAQPHSHLNAGLHVLRKAHPVCHLTGTF
jgi:hypothetical protein